MYCVCFVGVSSTENINFDAGIIKGANEKSKRVFEGYGPKLYFREKA